MPSLNPAVFPNSDFLNSAILHIATHPLFSSFPLIGYTLSSVKMPFPVSLIMQS